MALTFQGGKLSFREYVIGIFRPPHYKKDEERNRNAEVLRAITVVTLCGLWVVLLHRLLVGNLDQILPLSIIALLTILSILVGQFNYLDFSAGLFLWSILGFLEFMILKHDGTHDTVVLAIPAAIVAAGLLLNKRRFYAYSIAAILLVIGTGFAEIFGILHNSYSPNTNFSDLVDLAVILGITTVGIRLLSDSLKNSFARAYTSESEIRRQSVQITTSELRYRTLFESANDAIFILSDGKYVECNSMALHMFGCEHSSQIIGHHPWEFSPRTQPDGRESKEKAKRISDETVKGTPQRFYWKHLKLDGTEFDAEISLNCLRINGEMLIQAMVEDITERKRVEEALDLQISALESAANSIVITDAKGAIQWANQAFSKMTGYNVDEIVGKNPRFLKSGLQEDAFYAVLWETILSGEVWHGEIINKKKDGTIYDEEMTITPVKRRDGKICNYVAVKQDVTQRKKAQRLLSESEARFRAVVANSYDAVLFVDAVGTIKYLSPSYERISGYRAEELEGRSALQLIHPKDLRSVRDSFSALKEMSGTTIMQYRVVAKDGTCRWVEATGYNLLGDPNVKAIVANIRDITESRRAEEDLRESEKRYRNLVEVSPDAILIHQDYKVVFANPAAAKLLGVETRDEILGRSLFDAIHPEQHTWIHERYRRMVEENKPLEFGELRLIRVDGRAIDAESATIPTAWKGRAAAQVVIHDLSERKKAEAALQESEERFRSLSRVTFEGIMVHENGMIIDANQQFAELFGFPNSEILIGKKGLEILPMTRESRDLIKERLLSHSDAPLEISVLRPDGSTFPAETQSRKAVYRGQSAIVVTMRDITERKMAEKTLADSEKRFRALVENSSDVITLLDENGTILFDSSAIVHLFGFSPDERKGINIFELIHSEDSENARKVLTDLLGHPRESCSFLVRTKDSAGAWHWVETTASNLLDEESVRSIVLNSRDVTERKSSEEELNRSRAQLEKFSEHLENVLDEERKRISREIHDELGQMLTVLKFDLRWLNSKAKIRNRQFSEKIEEMESTLSQALVSVKRISKELRPPQIDALGLIGAIQLDVSQIERKVGLIARLKFHPSEFSVDKQLSVTIYRVFNEVLTNVVRHANAKKIDIELTQAPEFVVLRVQDDGRGISEKELEGSQSLGLAGMRERVRQRNGTLTIQGQTGKGTVVTAHFPLKYESMEESNRNPN